MQGVRRGHWIKSDSNKLYAVRAVRALRIDLAWLDRPTHLWRVVSQSQTKKPNGQMDVVFELWKTDLITQEPIPEDI